MAARLHELRKIARALDDLKRGAAVQARGDLCTCMGAQSHAASRLGAAVPCGGQASELRGARTVHEHDPLGAHNHLACRMRGGVRPRARRSPAHLAQDEPIGLAGGRSDAPEVTRRFWPPEMPRRMALPTTVSARPRRRQRHGQRQHVAQNRISGKQHASKQVAVRYPHPDPPCAHALPRPDRLCARLRTRPGQAASACSRSPRSPGRPRPRSPAPAAHERGERARAGSGARAARHARAPGVGRPRAFR